MRSSRRQIAARSGTAASRHAHATRARPCPVGEECSAELQTRTCNNGVLDEWPADCIETCEVTSDGADCGDIADGAFESRFCYTAETVAYGETCEGALNIRSCNDGVIDDWPEDCFDTCAVEEPADCGDVPHGNFDARPCFTSGSVPEGETCEATIQYRTCENGEFDPDFDECEFLTCSVE